MIDFEKDYYAILELKADASLQEVKTAYRRLVKKYHPDLHPGNKDYENRIREINEAYEVISNTDDKNIYDNFRARSKKQPERTDPFAANKKHYSRETNVTHEIRTYLKGSIYIKYHGIHIEEDALNMLRETFYRMTVTEISADIQASDISLPGEMPAEFNAVFDKVKPLELYINLPVETKIHDIEKTTHYALNIQRITIPDPVLDKVTKHEGESFGALSGTFYGYVSDFQTQTETELVTECFGETGRKETRREADTEFYRKEYFNTDCSTYWGQWVKIEIHETFVPTGKVENNGAYFRNQYYRSDYKNTYWGKWNYQSPPVTSSSQGCLGNVSGWLALLLIAITFIVFFPGLAVLVPLIAILFLLGLLPHGFWKWLARFFWGSIACIYLLLIAGLILESSKKGSSKGSDKVSKESAQVRSSVIRQKKRNNLNGDSIIINHIEWQDYKRNKFSGSYAVSSSDYKAARLNKLSLPFEATDQQNYDRIIYSLKEFDKSKMGGLYKMFDSLRSQKKLSRQDFAETMVSFVQSIPYTLVLPENCDASLYQDGFTARYLTSANARCDGNERFGINSPLEFITNLKGDCDTRTLLLYTIFSHYHYDIIMLSSAHYGHSLIGINLPYNGLSYPYENSNYVLWETTAPGAQAGMIPAEIADLNYWRISLKSK